mgnify:CR=1 FL=1
MPAIAQTVKQVVARYGGDATRLMDVLIDVDRKSTRLNSSHRT